MHEEDWVCCQIGAREHYMVARAVASRGKLRALITDVWMPPSLSRPLPHSRFFGGLRERFHPDLSGTRIYRNNSAFIRFDLYHRLRRTDDWTKNFARNQFFGRRAVRQLRHLPAGPPGTVFAYSYAALDLFRWAKACGWRTVLGQIDAGPVEVEIVRKESARQQVIQEPWEEPSPAYWQAWREECALADTIVVNSNWSRDALQQAGAPTQSIKVIPLAYESKTVSPPKSYPAVFTPDRPLRVLFLGQVILRKGIDRLIQAAKILRDQPVEFWIVGAPKASNLAIAAAGCRMRWFGAVSRSQAAAFYQQADLFILPTLSDGFALTQLEAMAQRLPVVASTCCGQVVRDGLNGRILPTPDAADIVAVVRECLAAPGRLAEWSKGASVAPQFSLDALTESLAAV